MTLFEVNQAAAIIRETSHPDVNMIFGAVIDPNMGDEIRITVIATGFERAGIPRRMVERPATSNQRNETHQRSEPQRPVVAPPTHPVQRQSESVSVSAAPVTPPPAVVNNTPTPEFKPQTTYQEDLDIPTFLRNRR
jgi:cell division protein FtsZ